MSRISKVVAVAAVCGAAVLAGAVSAGAAAESEAAPNVAVVSTRFDKLVYQPGDAASVTFKFTNYGAVDALKVANYAGGNGDPWELQITDWGGVRYDEGITVPAGGTVSVVLRGVVPEYTSKVGKVSIAYGFVGENGDSDLENNSGVARASVPGATGNLARTATYDVDGDRRHDPNEGVAGTKITLVGLYDIELITTAYTDQDGKAQFTGLPVGEYELRVTPPDGYWPVYGNTVSHAEVRSHEASNQFIEVEPIS